MDWYETIFEAIDMRSFSNLWYWIGLAVMWSSVSHWIIGVPFDMLQRARRLGGTAETDFEALVRINVNRLMMIGDTAGVTLILLGSAANAALATLGFAYGVEFAQAVFFLLFPVSIVGIMSFVTASRIRAQDASGEVLRRKMIRLRLWIQVLGFVSLVVTAFWGMWQTLALGALRGIG